MKDRYVFILWKLYFFLPVFPHESVPWVLSVPRTWWYAGLELEEVDLNGLMLSSHQMVAFDMEEPAMASPPLSRALQFLGSKRKATMQRHCPL